MHSELITWRDSGDFVLTKPLGLHVFYKDLGHSQATAEQTLLLVHGFPESSFSFNKVVDGLLKRFARIVLLDLPGHGFSDKPGAEYSYSLVPQADAALAVWQHLGVRGGHVLGHDMGTSVLTEIVARRVNEQLPAWFDQGLQSATFTNGSMVLALAELRVMQRLLLNKKVGPLISSLSRYALFRKTIISAHSGLSAVEGSQIRAEGSQTKAEGSQTKAEGSITEHDIQLLWQSCLQQDGHKKNHHIIRYLNDRRRYEQTRWLPALKIAHESLPMHICWGDADNVAKVSMAHYLKESICPSAQLTIMPGAGHFCQLGSPQLWLQSVLAFYA